MLAFIAWFEILSFHDKQISYENIEVVSKRRSKAFELNGNESVRHPVILP